MLEYLDNSPRRAATAVKEASRNDESLAESAEEALEKAQTKLPYIGSV